MPRPHPVETLRIGQPLDFEEVLLAVVDFAPVQHRRESLWSPRNVTSRHLTPPLRSPLSQSSHAHTSYLVRSNPREAFEAKASIRVDTSG